mmetsp:Transcript_9271/g.18897  ORF Transcript_9271/g.18897 Transcript_9271/m.18897 type:complete len:1302 (-) Transcript_9271:938-4843(-)|eukprot:CAMPEP_0184688294 /NCGR_PEP_ID=MMETSP0312-20130426/29336_1 /TAXON_ID=31354 /ORGANISM="Compsopogon coeruleus, Strain SAG 36.94" /LENGTH=1301 /DNA_ID=CAMNT_0027145287 /DNA_START=73 /DNA_END=3978 /DNA_ORIENTATION=-
MEVDDGESRERLSVDEMVELKLRDEDEGSQETRGGWMGRIWGNKGGKERDVKEEGSEEEKLKPSSVLELFQFADFKDKLLMLLGTLNALVHGTLLPLLIVVFGDVISEFGNAAITQSTDPLKAAFDKAKWFMLLGIVAWVTGFFQVMFWMIAAQRQCYRIRNLYFRSILTKHMGWYDTRDTGEMTIRVMTDVDLIQGGIGDKMSTFIMYFATFITGIVIGFIYSWKLTLVITAAIPLLMLSGAIFANVTASATTESQGAYARAGGVADEILSLIRTVTAFGGQTLASQRYYVELQEACRQGIRRAGMTGFAMGMTMFFIFSSYALGFWYGSRLVRSGELQAGDVVIVFFSVVLGAMSMGQAAPAISALTTARGAAPKIFSVIHEDSDIDPLSVEGRILEKVDGVIEFQDVDFTYPARAEQPVLNKMNLRVESGKVLALVGASGCGKSTSIQLVERFYDPQGGRVLLDGNPLNELNVRWLRSRIGLVAQMPTLFATSIKENIALGAGVEATTSSNGSLSFSENEPSMDDIIEAAKMANCHDFIMKLPEQYDTVIGERGAMLSGGQKQRIAIARALVRRPSILLLDEATSALDARSERLVQEALDRARVGRTTIVVAHRLSTVKNADMIAVVSGGRIIESGTHHELMHIPDGNYKALVELQNIREEEHDEVMIGEEEEVVVVTEPVPSYRKSQEGNTTMESTEKDLENAAEDTEQESKPGKEVILRAFKMSSPDTALIAFGVLGAVGVGCTWPLLGLVFANMSAVLVNPIAPQSDVTKYCLLFVGFGVLSWVSNLLQRGLLGLSGERLTLKLRSMYFNALLKQEIGFFDRKENSVGALGVRLGTESVKVKGLVGDLLGSIVGVISAISSGIIIAFTGCAPLAGVVLACIPIIATAAAIQMKLLIGFDSDAQVRYAGAGRVASEAVDTVRTVSSLGLEVHFLERYREELDPPLRTGRRQAVTSGLAFGFSEFSMFALWSIAFWYGTRLVQWGNCEFNGLMRAVVGLLFAAFSLGEISTASPDVAASLHAGSEIFRLLDRQSEIDPTNPDGTQLTEISGSIDVSKIQFEYPTRHDVKVLRKMTVSVSPGQTLALVGESGCGKSTLVGLLERFYDIREGSIRIDGGDIRSINLESLRSKMAIVSQEADLFNTSIRQNILYGLMNATDDQVIQAAKLANAHDFIMDLPNGYDTSVGERGSELSGGQRQRIAIARALVRDCKILLLDEATSALDSKSERIVQDALDNARRGRTTVVIAHRLSTIKNADIIAVVSDGRIVESGTHDELMAKHANYANLVRHQMMEAEAS